ncbi:MAG: TusE/DsrC/DsvC family sulfur relay protein [Planctomycetota bacterium]|jgi:tRNA 2-thiouridine synthesizing protein E
MGMEEVLVEQLDADGFLKEMSNWTKEMVEELALRNDLAPLTEDHWKIIEFVRQYYVDTGLAPPVVKIGRALQMQPTHICDLFPCGMAKGAYRLAGLPRPPGCL